MKKITILALALCAGMGTFAQSNEQIQNKNGVDIMPVSGEFALGLGVNLFSATGWIGNMFGYTGNNGISQTYINNPLFAPSISITGKYMMSDNNALRVSFYNQGSDVTTNYKTYDDRANDPDSTVVDTYRSNTSQTYVSAGWEWRRGKSRLRGIYGGEAVISWSNSHEHYTYGNQLGVSNMTPTSSIGFWDAQHGRVTERRFGAGFGVGVRGFAGVEYFVAPKICIGTEFGWSILMSQGGKSKFTYEKYDPFAENGNGAIITHTDESYGSRTISSGIDNFNTQLYFHFYF